MPLLGLDVGTTGSRALLIADDGGLLAEATQPHAPFASPRIGWAEQDPEDWWRASHDVIRAAIERAGIPAAAIRAVGLSGQMHGAVLLDADDRIVRPALIWCDQRTTSQCERLTALLGRERLLDLTLNPALTGFTLPKLLWVREHEPHAWARVQRVLLPKDYVRFRLTGAYATDVADASGTLLFDVGRRRWSGEMLAASQIPQTMLPDVLESVEVSGRVSSEGHRATGLVEGTLVVAGAGDQAANAVGIGIVRPGAVSATIGTSGVVFAATARPLADPQGRVHTFCHAIPGRWHVMGVTQAAGLSLRWFRETFGLAAGCDPGMDPYEALCQEAASVTPGADGLLWAPYLMGERTPHLDPEARGVLAGLAATHRRPHVIRAILEGVAFSLRDSLVIFEELSIPIGSVRLGGGGARSPLWRQIQADVYGRPVDVPAVQEGAAYGAALLAGVAAGVWRSVEAASEAAIRIAGRLDPDPAATAVLNGRYRQYRAMYDAWRTIARASERSAS
jgi:xylulokinase